MRVLARCFLPLSASLGAARALLHVAPPPAVAPRATAIPIPPVVPSRRIGGRRIPGAGPSRPVATRPPNAAGARARDGAPPRPAGAAAATRGVSLSASSGDGDGDDDKDDLVARRERRIVAEYRVSSALYLCSAAYLAAGGLFPSPAAAAYACAGPAMASATGYILSGAAQHHRLGSDTYKRLNLFLAYFGFCGVLSFALRDGPRAAAFALPYFIGLKPSLKGWRYGVRGVDKGGDASLFGELVKGATSTLKGVLSVKNVNAAGYLAATLFVATLKLMKLIDVVNFVRAGGFDLFVGGRIIRYGKLSLLTGILYTLKDAADRGRLEGTTFVQLNFLSSAVLGTLFAYSIQGGEILVTRQAGAAALSSAFCACNGVSSMIKKRRDA